MSILAGVLAAKRAFLEETGRDLSEIVLNEALYEQLFYECTPNKSFQYWMEVEGLRVTCTLL